MEKKFVWLVGSCLMVVALLVAACAPAPAVKEAAPVVKEAAPVVKEAAPVVKEAAPAAPENMVKVSLTKGDGTVVAKLVEKPKYGGTLILYRGGTILAWDEAYQAPWTLSSSLAPTNQDLVQGDWKRGHAGTGEVSWWLHDWFSLKNVTGELVESWEFPDDETIIYHIRKGVRWALDPSREASRLVGGREFTADDVVFNIRRIYMDIPTSTMYGMLGESRPLDVYGKDKYTVVIKAPKGSLGKTFQEVSDLTKMVPPEVVKKYGDMNKWENVVGTGAFILVDYVPMSSVLWKRNPNYWEKDPVRGADYPLPYVDTLKTLIIPDRSTQLAALRTGKVDVTPYPGLVRDDALSVMKTRTDMQSVKQPAMRCNPLGLGRVDKPELPFKDIRVRKALLMAIDRQKICDTYYGGDAWILNFKIAPTPEYTALGWYTPLEELPPEIKELYTYNPVKAKQLLTEAGYPNGFKTEVVISSSGIEQIDNALMVKEYWAKIGVDLTLDIKEPAVATSLYQRKTFKEMYYGGRGGNPDSMYCVRRGNMYNWAMIDDPKIEQYYTDITAAFFDDAKKNKLMKEMNLYVLSQAWYYDHPYANAYFLWQPWLKGYYGEMGPGIYSYNQWCRYVWLDQELKKSLGY